MVSSSSATSSATATAALRERYQTAAEEPEIQAEEPTIEVPPMEETVPFEEPVAAETVPVSTAISTEAPVIPTRNGDPDPAISTPQEKVPAEKSGTPAKQEVLQFEPVTRGRFEKSEPTIIEGEDLDVPTYLRKHIKVK